ncbi:MAG TPA: PEGA domain-containing protein [Polyangiaceae bacterium]
MFFTRLVVLVLGLCIARPALADGYDSAVTRAAAARDRALETDNARDWQEALELFAAAIEFRPTKEAEFEFAEAALRLELEDEAFTAYRAALALGLEGKARERAAAFVETHEPRLGRLAVSGPTGARVYVDERKRGVLPLAEPIVVSPGTRSVHVDATNFRSFERHVVVDAGATTAITATLEPLVASPASSARTPSDTAQRALPTSKESPHVWATPALIAGGGLVLAGAATFVVTTIALGNQRDKLDKQCVIVDGDECAATTPELVSAAQATSDDIATSKTVRWVSVSAAAVGAGIAAVSLIVLTGSSEPEHARLSIRPLVSEHSLGAEWHGEF